jgi:hypothetical protein
MMSVVLEEGRRGLFIAKGERGDDAPPVLIDSCILISLPPPLKGWQVVIPIEKLERKEDSPHQRRDQWNRFSDISPLERVSDLIEKNRIP